MRESWPRLSSPSLSRDTLWYGGATVAERAASLLIIPLLTKSLPQELYGVWAQIVVSGGLMSGIILLSFQTAAVRFLAGRTDNRDIAGTFHRMLSVVFVNCVVASVLTVVFAPGLSRVMFGDERFVGFARVLGIFWASEALFELTAAFLRARQRIRALSGYYVLKNGARMVLLVVALLVLRLDLIQAIILIILFQGLLTLFIYLRDVMRPLSISNPIANVRWREILHFSLPLVPYGILMWANNFVDRYLILHMLDIRQVSIYAVGYSLGATVGLFYSVAGFTLYPHMAERWNEGDRLGAAEALRKATGYYVFLATPFVAIVTILNAPLIRTLTTADYVPDWQVVLWLSLGVSIFGIYQLSFISMVLADRTMLNFGIVAASVCSNVILNWLLIPRLGIVGAALATALSNGVLAVWTTTAARRSLPYAFPWRMSGGVILATVIMSFSLLLLNRYVEIDGVWMLLVSGTLAIGIYGAIGWVTQGVVCASNR